MKKQKVAKLAASVIIGLIAVYGMSFADAGLTNSSVLIDYLLSSAITAAFVYVLLRFVISGK